MKITHYVLTAIFAISAHAWESAELIRIIRSGSRYMKTKNRFILFSGQ